jgi:hypothetical protein
VKADHSTVRVEVEDVSPQMPAVVADPETSGYGLHIVDRLATRWGVESSGADGKVVWFEISRGAGTDGASR